MGINFSDELLVHRHRGTQVTGAGAAVQLWMRVDFSWDAVGGADSYQLSIGTSSGASDYDTYNTAATSYTAYFPPGTYYWRVRAVTNGTPGTPTADQTFYA